MHTYMNNEQNNIIKVHANDSTVKLNLRELLNYRDLFIVLAYRDLRVRYAQAFLGLIWVLLQPLITLLVITLVFGRFVEVDTGGIPYPIFAIPGVALWTYFSFVLSQAGNSFIGSQEMVKKIYFPRIIIPLSKAVVGLVDLLVALLLLIILFLFYKISPTSNLIYFPLFVIMTILAALAIGIWMSALTIRYRDIQYIIPFFVQFGLYITPIAYPSETLINKLPDWFAYLYYLNPMACIIEGFRWSLLGGELNTDFYTPSLLLILFLFVSGIYYFKKTERLMADLL